MHEHTKTGRKTPVTVLALGLAFLAPTAGLSRPVGALEEVDSRHVSGWVTAPDHPGEPVPVELHLTQAGKDVAPTLTQPALRSRPDLAALAPGAVGVLFTGFSAPAGPVMLEFRAQDVATREWVTLGFAPLPGGDSPDLRVDTASVDAGMAGNTVQLTVTLLGPGAARISPGPFRIDMWGQRGSWLTRHDTESEPGYLVLTADVDLDANSTVDQLWRQCGTLLVSVWAVDPGGDHLIGSVEVGPP